MRGRTTGAVLWIAMATALALAPAAARADGDGEPEGTDAAADGDAAAASVPRGPFRFEIASPDGAYRLRIGLVAQLWAHADDAWTSDSAVDHDLAFRVGFRRIRLSLGGNAFTRDLTYRLQLSLLPGDFEMLDLYADYALVPGVRVRAGVWKIPFSRLRTRSYKHRQLVDWPIVSTYLGAERQIGVALHDGYDRRTPPPLEWALGVFTGVNTRTSHAVGPSMLWPVDEPLSGRPVHPELVARIGYNHGGIDTTGEGDLEGSEAMGGRGAPGPFRFAVHLSAAWDLAPVWGEDWAVRAALEWLMKVAGYSLAVGGYVATVQVGDTPAEQEPGAGGLFAATGFTLGRRLEIAVEYALVDPLDRDDTVHELRGGLNVFLVGRRVQWRTDAGAVITTLGEGERATEMQVRSLIQVEL